jgi:enoyl-CoA hydratase/carnithine racemase
MAGIKTEFL